MPVLGMITGGADFSSYFIRLGAVPAGFTGDPHNYAALKAAGVPMLGYGQFVTTLVQFLILAFVVYQLVRVANRLTGPQAEPAATGPSEELVVLREIRDALKHGA
jgi:large conductance mechanosensitive channel